MGKAEKLRRDTRKMTTDNSVSNNTDRPPTLSLGEVACKLSRFGPQQLFKFPTRQLSQMATIEVSQRCKQQLGDSVAQKWQEIILLGKQPGVVDLGQGYPDVTGSAIAREAASQSLLEDPFAGPGRDEDKPVLLKNQYAPLSGLPELLEAINMYTSNVYNTTYDPKSEMVVVTSGTEGLYCAIQAFIDPGDEVVIFQPYFPWYLPHVQLAGGVSRVITLQPPDFRINREILTEAITPKTKMVIFNTPHNPTGSVGTEDDLKIIAELCIKNNCLVVSDEVYENYTFGNRTHKRIADLPGMMERTITLSSASKLFSLTGWRVGWFVGPKELIGPIKTMHGFCTYSAPTPLQAAVAAALKDTVRNPQSLKEESDLFHENAVRLATSLDKFGLTVCPPQGGYFLVAEVTESGMSDFDYCKWLAKEKKVAAVPMRFFVTNPEKAFDDITFIGPTLEGRQFVRFAICKRRETIDRAVMHLA